MAFFKRRFNKYGNKKIQKAGIWFDSKGESALHDDLLLQEKAGLIRDIKCQDSVYLSRAKILYKPDFSYTVVATMEEEFAEYKGCETAVWRIKRKLWMSYGPGKLKIFKGHYQKGIFLHEEIVPTRDLLDSD